MKYFLDTEFLEGIQKKRILGIPYGYTKNTIDLISIGIVSEDGREYYEVSKDFNLEEAWGRYQWKHKRVSDTNTIKEREYWIRENVLKPIFIDFLKLETKYLIKQRRIIGYAPLLDTQFIYSNFKKLLNKFGKSNKEIAEEVKDFCRSPNEQNNIEFYTYYGAYDWVVFCWLFGKMIDLPKGFPMFSRDLKVMLNDKVIPYYSNAVTPVNHTYKKSIENGFMLNTCLKLAKQDPMYPAQDKNKKHNALDDAKWNLKLYNFINSI